MVEARFPDAKAALLAGSRSRGEARANSDFDVVLLYQRLTNGAWREMLDFAGEPFECFVHDLGTLRYFLDEIERPSGNASLAVMVAEGIVLVDEGELLPRARRMAQQLIADGPTRWSEEDLAARRYAITDLAETLRTTENPMMVGAALLETLGTFCLRAAGRWPASEKTLAWALASWDAEFAEAFEHAFEALFAGDGDSRVQTLVDHALQPYGGRLRVGFRQQAPASWRRE